MVSGFFTSPYDQARIISGEASPILIESNCSTGACCLKSLSKSFITDPHGLRPDSHGLRPTSDGVGYTDPVRIAALRAGTNGTFPSILFQLHVDAERSDLLDEHVE